MPGFGFPPFMEAVEELALSTSKQPMAIAVAAKPPRRFAIEVISPSLRPALVVLITVFIDVYSFPFFLGAERPSSLSQFVLVTVALVATVPRMLPRCTTWELDFMYRLLALHIRLGSQEATGSGATPTIIQPPPTAVFRGQPRRRFTAQSVGATELSHDCQIFGLRPTVGVGGRLRVNTGFRRAYSPTG